MKMVIATRNPDKLAEICTILEPLGAELVAAADIPGLPEVEEDQPTLEGNAAKKALVIARAAGAWAVADDTGLEVAALDGRPGVYSARYAGVGASYQDNRRKLLAELDGVPVADRGARFRTVAVLASPAGEVLTAEGSCAGVITTAERGSGGFGYDPVFEVSGPGRTMAQMSAAEKNAVSHRGRAFRALARQAPEWLAARMS